MEKAIKGAASGNGIDRSTSEVRSIGVGGRQPIAGSAGEMDWLPDG